MAKSKQNTRSQLEDPRHFLEEKIKKAREGRHSPSFSRKSWRHGPVSNWD